MSALFKAEVDNTQGKAALGEMEDGLRDVAQEARATTGALGEAASEAKAAGNALENAADAETQFANLKSEIYELKRGLEATQAEAAAAKKQLDGLASSKANWAEMTAAAGGAVQVVKMLADGFQKARQYIKEMADSGNSEFQKLNQSIEGVVSRWDEMMTRITASAEGKELGEFFGKGADGAGEFVSALAYLDEGLNRSADSWRKWVADATGIQSVKDWADAAAKSTDAVAEASQKAYEVEVQRQNVARAGKVEADLAKSRAQETHDAELEQIKSLEEIENRIKAQIEAAKKLAAENRFNAKEDKASREEIVRLENRRKQIVKERADEEKRIEEEATKEREEEIKTHEEYVRKQLEQRVETIRQSILDEIALEAEAHRKRLEMHAEYNAARQKQIDELAGKSEVKDASSEIHKQAADPRAIAKRLADTAADTAAVQTKSANPEASERDIERAMQEARRQAFRQAMQQQAGKGPQGADAPFSQEQITGAVNQNAQAMTSAMQSQGKLSSDMVDALNVGVNVAQQTDQNVAQLSQAVAAMQQALGEVGKNGRKVAQTMGRKQ